MPDAFFKVSDEQYAEYLRLQQSGDVEGLDAFVHNLLGQAVTFDLDALIVVSVCEGLTNINYCLQRERLDDVRKLVQGMLGLMKPGDHMVRDVLEYMSNVRTISKQRMYHHAER